jgi:hypothetical protein
MQDNVQFIIILAAIVLGAVLVARFWRTILKWLLLVIGVILIIGIVGLWLKNAAVPQVDIQLPQDAGGVIGTIAGLLDLASAVLPKSEPACPAPTYTAPAGPSFGEILLSVLLVLALGGAGYFWIRWRITRRRDDILPRPQRRRRRPAYAQQPVVYIVPEETEWDDEDEGVDLNFLGGLDPGTWGF